MNIYVSHPIRGINRTDSSMAVNCLKAKIFGAALRIRYPYHTFYVPAEHEEFVQLAYEEGIMDENAILAVDCEILGTKDAVVFYDHEYGYSHGMKVEDDARRTRGLLAVRIYHIDAVVCFPELEEVLIK